jgi:hypothetical protein
MVTDNLLALLKINSSKRTSKFSRLSSRLPSLILSRTSTILVDRTFQGRIQGKQACAVRFGLDRIIVFTS